MFVLENEDRFNLVTHFCHADSAQKLCLWYSICGIRSQLDVHSGTGYSSVDQTIESSSSNDSDLE